MDLEDARCFRISLEIKVRHSKGELLPHVVLITTIALRPQGGSKERGEAAEVAKGICDFWGATYTLRLRCVFSMMMGQLLR